jgi:hypothetical protein
VATRLQTSFSTTLACIVDEEYPLSIIRASREYGDDAVIKKISAKLCEYLDMVNLRSSMNAAQIAMAAKLIAQRHPHLPLKAIGVFFEDAMCCAFGPHYGRMDISVLMEWLQKFENSYFEIVEERAYQEHQSTKGDNANFVDILQKHKALEGDEDKPVPMPEHMFVEYKQKRLRKEIADRVHKQNAHLYSQMSVQEADRIIDQLIQDELKKNNLTNQN